MSAADVGCRCSGASMYHEWDEVGGAAMMRTEAC